MLRYILLLLTGCLCAQSVNSEMKTAPGKQFIDSLISSFEDGLNVQRIYFTADPLDADTLHSKFSPLSNCTETPIFKPVLTNTFDTLEYYAFKNSPGLSFIDSVNYLNNNEIKGSWFKVCADSNNILLKMITLGREINIDFGLPLSISYYKSGRLSMHLNSECDKLHGKTLVRLIDYEMDKTKTEHWYVVSENMIEHFYVKY